MKPVASQSQNNKMAEGLCYSEPESNYLQSKVSTDLVVHGGSAGPLAEIGTKNGKPRAKWSHQMRRYLIGLLKDYDVPGFRTQNAWNTEAWTHIVSRLNQKFGVSFSVKQVKQKEQDLKKDYRSVKDLLDESGFGWYSEKNMVDASDSVWASFAARRNSKDALQWRDKSFPYYDELVPLYEGRYAEGRTRQGMDHYASNTKNALIPSSEPTDPNNLYQSQSPTMPTMGQSDMPFTLDEEVEQDNLDSPPHLSTPLQHVQPMPRSTQT
uniref:Uncharacterized protein n=1 Tax=Avena sativa TaxID=4498 RepID=A0ACD5U7T3_AVESA